MIKIGGNKGPGVVLALAIRYFLWGLFRNKKLAFAISLPFALALRLLDQFMGERAMWDGPSGVYFLGNKSDKKLMQNELPSLYEGFQRVT